MKKTQDEKRIPLEELNIYFDDQTVIDLDQKLFNGEITLEEYREAIHKA